MADLHDGSMNPSSAGGAHKAIFNRIVGALLVAALLVTGFFSGVSPQSAFAEDGTAAPRRGADPDAKATLQMTYAGTGHSDGTGTFITSANGYSPADDSPTDNVVSSNDYVGFDMVVRIPAGGGGAHLR